MVLSGGTPLVQRTRWSAKTVLGGIGVFLLILFVEVILGLLSGN